MRSFPTRRVATAALAACLLSPLAGLDAARAVEVGAGTSPSSATGGEPSTGMPEELQQVRFDQRLGNALPLDATFLDENGVERTLGSYFDDTPVVLTLVYHDCPMLCVEVLSGLTGALKTMQFTPGNEFDVLAVSFDEKDTPETATLQKAHYLERYGKPETAGGWHFLTGPQASIDALTDAVGFEYGVSDDREQFAHAAGIVVATPEGKIARYFFGIDYPPRDLRLGLIEASEEKIGNVVDAVLLYCFNYDPTTGRYGAVVMNIMRLAGAATVVLIVGYITIALWRERRRTRLSEVPS